MFDEGDVPVPALTLADVLDAPDESAAWLAGAAPGVDAVAVSRRWIRPC